MMKKFTLKADGGKNASHGVRKECPIGQNHANLFSNKYFIEKKNKSSQGLPVWRHINIGTIGNMTWRNHTIFPFMMDNS